MNFSVLLSVYHKEEPLFLKEALESIYENQTLKPSEIVIIKDGKLTNDLDKIIDKYERNYPKIFNVISLPENKGLGNALKVGVEACQNELIARMDTDDIAFLDRFEKQIRYIKENPDTDVLGGQLEEFNQTPGDLKQYRKLPVNHDNIAKFAKFRSPMNHPTVMFRRSKVLEAGNYGAGLLLWEDYTLWVNMLSKGFVFHNLEDVVLYFRVKDGQETIKRRRGLSYARNEMKFANYARKVGFFSLKDYLKYILIKPIGRLLPTSLVMKIYNKFYRR